MSKNITIADVLRGCEVGRMQQVGLMQVLPLLSDLEDDRFSTPDEVETGTSTYGVMNFSNPTGKPVIVPCNAACLVEQAAQDHALSGLALIKANARKEYAKAMCVQQSQGGLISKGKHSLIVLPHALRQAVFPKRKDTSFQKLWEDIGKFNKSMGCDSGGGRGHLEYFTKKFEKQLEQFVAEFEVVPRQIGAIILVNGEVVGVERTPSTRYWKSVWGTLIRECYGSLALQVASESPATIPASRIPLPPGIGSLDDLSSALARIVAEEESRAKDVVRRLVSDPFKVEAEEREGEFFVESLSHVQFAGQIVRDSEYVVYASFVTTKDWKGKNKKWHEAPAFKV